MDWETIPPHVYPKWIVQSIKSDGPSCRVGRRPPAAVSRQVVHLPRHP